MAHFMQRLWSKHTLEIARVPLLLAIVALSLWGGQAASPVQAAEGFVDRWSGQGNYGIVAGAVGLLDTGTGEFSLNVPGTVVQAYLYWSGMNLDGNGGDDTITMTVDETSGGTPVSLTADITFGPEPWIANDYDHYVYVEDVTALVPSGNHTYSFTDFAPLTERYGAAILAFYEDPNLPESALSLRDGLDSLFAGFPPPQGPNSLVECTTFAPSTTARDMEFVFLGGGVNIATEARPNDLWAITGQGTPPSGDIIAVPGAFTIEHITDDYPFDSHNGNAIDLLPSDDTINGALTIPANDTYVCFQVESVNDEPDGQGGTLLGASMLWQALAISLPVVQQDPLTGSIGDRVWDDTDQNGVQDPGELGIPGVTVTLYDENNAVVATTTTNDSGNYLFDDVPAGNYYVGFSTPDGYTPTTPNVGDDAQDSDADTGTGLTPVFALAAGEDNLTLDAGFYQNEQTPTGSIGDFVWEDSDGDGMQDSGEPGIPGVVVNLYDTAGDLIATTTTNASGFYAFLGLDPGSYVVEFVPPSGYEFTTANAGGDATDSDADPATGRTAIIVLASGQNDPTWDAGLTRSTTPQEEPTPEPDKFCLEISTVPGANPGDTVTYTVIVRNPSGAIIDPARLEQTLNTAVYQQFIGVTTQPTFNVTIVGDALIIDFGAMDPGDVFTLTITVQARNDLASRIFDPELFQTPRAQLFVCGQPAQQPTTAPQPTVDIAQITGLPATGYPPADSAAGDSGINVTTLALLALALTALGALALTLRKAR